MPLETGRAEMRMTNVTMEWEEGKGAYILSSIPITCPVCGINTESNVEHRCGNRVPRTKPSNRKASPPDGGRAGKE
jgi:hypothetical protein